LFFNRPYPLFLIAVVYLLSCSQTCLAEDSGATPDLKAALEKNQYQALLEAHDSLLAKLKKDPEDEGLSGYYETLGHSKNIPLLKKWSQKDGGSYVPWVALAWALIEKGWEYRGSDVASKVPKDKWKPFQDCLEEAKAYLDKTEEGKADDPYPYLYLMVIGKTHCRAKYVMRKYFEEALQACPDCLDAKFYMASFLSPMWCGSDVEMREFVDEETKKAPPGSGTRLLLVDYHWEVLKTKNWAASYTGKTDVWKEVRAVFEDYLSHHPDRHSTRCWYAYWAYYSKHYAEAKKQFDLLGDNWKSDYWTEKSFKDAKAYTDKQLEE